MNWLNGSLLLLEKNLDCDYSTSKGYRQFWKLRSSFFSKGFKGWMEKEVLVNAESDDYIQSIKWENPRRSMMSNVCLLPKADSRGC